MKAPERTQPRYTVSSFTLTHGGLLEDHHHTGHVASPCACCDCRDAPQGESVETSSKRKVIRVESEETQDYVCGMLAISQEEAEVLAFVPSAFSEPRGSIYFCDNRRSEKTVRYWQFASVCHFRHFLLP